MRPKNGQIWSKVCIFGHFGPNIGIFCPFRPMPDLKPMRTRCLDELSVIWKTKLLISWVKIRIFGSRTTKFGHKLAFLFILGQALTAHLVPFGRLVGGCGARAVSRKTPNYLQHYLHYNYILTITSYIVQLCTIKAFTSTPSPPLWS